MSTPSGKYVPAVLVVLITALATPVLAESSDDLSREHSKHRMTSRKVDHPKSNIDWGRAEIVLEAPFEDVLAAVRDYDRYVDLLPFFTASRIISTGDAGTMVKIKARISRLLKFHSKMKFTETPMRTRTHVIEGRQVSGNLERLDARWELTPLHGRDKTRVVFQVLVDPDVGLLSDKAATNHNLVSARRIMRALRSRVEK
jgi:ribosome-associated toxin RatA of RatAB toxin-antitoxin module